MDCVSWKDLLRRNMQSPRAHQAIRAHVFLFWESDETSDALAQSISANFETRAVSREGIIAGSTPQRHL